MRSFFVSFLIATGDGLVRPGRRTQCSRERQRKQFKVASKKIHFCQKAALATCESVGDVASTTTAVTFAPLLIGCVT